MRACTRSVLLLAVAAAVGSVAVAGTVSVTFVNAAGFSDAGAVGSERDSHLRALAAHLEALCQRQLPADQSLRVEVLDVDLAGIVRPSPRAGRDLRVAHGGADWPRIHVRYTLAAGGQSIISGEERLSDMGYLAHQPGHRNSDPLYYEKRLLDTWFKERLVERRAAGG